MTPIQSRRQAPLYAIGARITAPLGVAIVRGVRRSSRADVYMVEVAYETRPGIWTYQEDELSALKVTRAPLPRFAPGETVHTPDGQAVIRNIIGGADALVQDIGTRQTRSLPLSDLSPPLEAA